MQWPKCRECDSKDVDNNLNKVNRILFGRNSRKIGKSYSSTLRHANQGSVTNIKPIQIKLICIDLNKSLFFLMPFLHMGNPGFSGIKHQ